MLLEEPTSAYSLSFAAKMKSILPHLERADEWAYVELQHAINEAAVPWPAAMEFSKCLGSQNAFPQFTHHKDLASVVRNSVTQEQHTAFSA